MIFAKFFDEVTDLYDLFWIKSDRRFIQNNDLRIPQHCLCKSDSLPVAF